MGTVVALASIGGVAIAGDTRAVDDGSVASRNAGRVFELDATGVGAAGDPADVQTFRRELEAELRTLRLEHDELSLDKRARIAARVADRSDVAVVIGGRSSDGRGCLREIRPDGGVFAQSAVALGDGAELAVGQLEALEPNLDLAAIETAVTEVLGRVADRDVSTGDELDVWSLASAPNGERDDDR